MKTFLTAALLLSFSLAAYASEKGGNTDRSYELEISLREFEGTNLCPIFYDSEATMKAICDELGEEIRLSPGNGNSKNFYRKCCGN